MPKIPSLLATIALGAIACAPARAQPAAPPPARPIPAPGGALNPAERPRDVYLAKPRAAKVPPGPACALAARYVALVSAGRYGEVAGLFAPDADLLEPTMSVERGTAEIAGFYTKSIGRMQPNIVAVAYLGDRTDCVVELAIERVEGARRFYTLVSVDHFTVDASGKASRMIAFSRPQAKR